MAWLLLIIAGLLEIVWAIGLKYADGFTKPMPSAVTFVAMVASVYFLALAGQAPTGAHLLWSREVVRAARDSPSDES